MNTSHHGGCQCGRVRFEISARIEQIVLCHCSRCRKAQGSAFAANGFVPRDRFRLTQGETNLTAYESIPGQTKYFCSTCGSPVYSENQREPERIRIRLGLLDGDIEERPIAHIFATSKANWETICGDLPQYEGHEPGRGY